MGFMAEQNTDLSESGATARVRGIRHASFKLQLARVCRLRWRCVQYPESPPCRGPVWVRGCRRAHGLNARLCTRSAVVRKERRGKQSCTGDHQRRLELGASWQRLTFFVCKGCRTSIRRSAVASWGCAYMRSKVECAAIKVTKGTKRSKLTCGQKLERCEPINPLKETHIHTLVITKA